MKIVGTETLHTGRKFAFAVHIVESAQGHRFHQEFIDHPGAVVLLPVLDGDKVVLIRNYRHAIDGPLWELPAGTVQPGEEVAITAARELLEETGYRAKKLTQMLEFYPAPGATNEKMHLFLAEELTPGEAAPEPDEEMQVHLFDLDAALAMIDNGEIVDGKTILGLWHYSLTRGRRCITG